MACQRPDRCIFEDSEQNRLHLLRFVFAHHFHDNQPIQLFGLLDPYRRAGEIVIEASHAQYQIEPFKPGEIDPSRQ